MGRMHGKMLMKKLDVSKSSPSCWLLALDEHVQTLKPYLENLKFKVVTFEKGLDTEEIHRLLRKSKIDFFISDRGENFTDYYSGPLSSSPTYHLIWIVPDLLNDLERTFKAIADSILYDLRFRCGVPSDRQINGMCITDLPEASSKPHILRRLGEVFSASINDLVKGYP
jgi:hypothetical protein